MPGIVDPQTSETHTSGRRGSRGCGANSSGERPVGPANTGRSSRLMPHPERDGAADASRPTSEIAGARRIVNAMTVDVEEYYQVSAFSERVMREDWERLPTRVEGNTDAVLRMFAEHGVRATFFTLGWVAERHPSLIRRIVDAGHELASHGYAHFRVCDQSPDVFRADVRRTKQLLEGVGGVPVLGYRAASFSIDEKTLWAFDVLAEEGYAYSSSVYPIRHDHYGMVDAPRFAYRPRGDGGIVELPIATVGLFSRNLPCGGGGYFRVLPYRFSAWALRRVNRVDAHPCIFFFHPWEIDPDQPRQRGLSLKSRLRHYTNLRGMEGRLRKVLAQFAWDRMDVIFLSRDESATPVPSA